MTTTAQNGQVQKTQASAPATNNIKGIMEKDSIKKRFEEILGEKAPGFISSVINVVNGSTMLSKADPNSIIMSAAVAASLDLPINPNLGFAYIIPYGSRAQFQMGYKGFIQLAKRSGQYLKINAVEVRAGQLIKANHLTEEFEFDFDKGQDGEVIGFVAYFKELNGFEKTVYWNVQKMITHAKRHSKSYGQSSSPWTTDFIAMGKKTVLKHTLSTYGTLSIQMQKAVNTDQAEVKNFEGTEVEYVDTNHEDLTNQNHLEAGADNHTPDAKSEEFGGGENKDIPNSEEL